MRVLKESANTYNYSIRNGTGTARVPETLLGRQVEVHDPVGPASKSGARRPGRWQRARRGARRCALRACTPGQSPRHLQHGTRQPTHRSPKRRAHASTRRPRRPWQQPRQRTTAGACCHHRPTACAEGAVEWRRAVGAGGSSDAPSVRSRAPTSGTRADAWTAARVPLRCRRSQAPNTGARREPPSGAPRRPAACCSTPPPRRAPATSGRMSTSVALPTISRNAACETTLRPKALGCRRSSAAQSSVRLSLDSNCALPSSTHAQTSTW
eukprot:scaffold4600_cov74-Phaeocystis_antarctica.AAC.9